VKNFCIFLREELFDIFDIEKDPANGEFYQIAVSSVKKSPNFSRALLPKET